MTDTPAAPAHPSLPDPSDVSVTLLELAAGLRGVTESLSREIEDATPDVKLCRDLADAGQVLGKLIAEAASDANEHLARLR